MKKCFHMSHNLIKLTECVTFTIITIKGWFQLVRLRCVPVALTKIEHSLTNQNVYILRHVIWSLYLHNATQSLHRKSIFGSNARHFWGIKLKKQEILQGFQNKTLVLLSKLLCIKFYFKFKGGMPMQSGMLILQMSSVHFLYGQQKLNLESAKTWHPLWHKPSFERTQWGRR